jgi:hypothetical protein
MRSRNHAPRVASPTNMPSRARRKRRRRDESDDDDRNGRGQAHDDDVGRGVGTDCTCLREGHGGDAGETDADRDYQHDPPHGLAGARSAARKRGGGCDRQPDRGRLEAFRKRADAHRHARTRSLLVLQAASAHRECAAAGLLAFVDERHGTRSLRARPDKSNVGGLVRTEALTKGSTGRRDAPARVHFRQRF